MKLTILPLTLARSPDLEAIFTAKGCSVARGCWCMYYRRSGGRAQSLPNASALRRTRRTSSSCAPAERPASSVIATRCRSGGSRSAARRVREARAVAGHEARRRSGRMVGDLLRRAFRYRHQGVAEALLESAIAYARKHGAKSSRPTRWTSRAVRTTTPCGLARSPCTTRPASRGRASPHRPVVRRTARRGRRSRE